MALNKVLFRSKLELTTEQIVNNSNTMILSTVQEDVQYLDKAHERLLTFNDGLYDDSDNSIIKKSLAKKLADSGLSFSDLKKLYSSTGARGVAAFSAGKSAFDIQRKIATRYQVLHNIAENNQFPQDITLK